MGHSQCESSFTFGDPGYYRIVAQGRLDPSDADRLGGMAITMASMWLVGNAGNNADRVFYEPVSVADTR